MWTRRMSYRGLILINDYLVLKASEIQFTHTMDASAYLAGVGAEVAGGVEWRLLQMATPLPTWAKERQGAPKPPDAGAHSGA